MPLNRHLVPSAYCGFCNLAQNAGALRFVRILGAVPLEGEDGRIEHDLGRFAFGQGGDIEGIRAQVHDAGIGQLVVAAEGLERIGGDDDLAAAGVHDARVEVLKRLLRAGRDRLVPGALPQPVEDHGDAAVIRDGADGAKLLDGALRVGGQQLLACRQQPGVGQPAGHDADGLGAVAGSGVELARRFVQGGQQVDAARCVASVAGRAQVVCLERRELVFLGALRVLRAGVDLAAQV